MTNTLAYYDTELITAVESFMLHLIGLTSTCGIAIFYQRNLHKFLRSVRQTCEDVWVNYSKKIVKFVRYEVLAMKNDAQGPML